MPKATHTLPRIDRTVISHTPKTGKDVFTRGEHPDTRSDITWVQQMRSKGFKNVTLQTEPNR